MYCHKCGNKIEDESARFCPKCGTELIIEPVHEQKDEQPKDEILQQNHEQPLEQHVEKTNEMQENQDNAADLDDTNHFDQPSLEEITSRVKLKEGRKSSLWPIALPVLSLILSSCLGYFYYEHQMNINEQVVHMKDRAENAALNGEYKQALTLLGEAANLRPTYKVLLNDQKQIQKALELEKSLETISTSLKKQELDKADSKINDFKDSLKSLKGPLFSPFQKKIEDKETTLAVAKIKVEIDKLKTVDQLASKLTTLSSIKSKESEEVNQLIRSKIVTLTLKDAEKLLNKKQYSDAINSVDKGLNYANKNSKLISFKDRIKKEQTAFEQAEKERIKQAMEVAAQEDLNNHTAAVSVENLDVYIDEYGDLNITGDVKNTATVPISSITLYYTMYDSRGNTIGSDSMYVDSYYLEPGKVSSFSDTQFGVNEEVTVEIDNANWYLQ